MDPNSLEEDSQIFLLNKHKRIKNNKEGNKKNFLIQMEKSDTMREQSLQSIREPIRNAIADLLKQRSSNGKYNAKYFPTEPFLVLDGKVHCPNLEWLVTELKDRGYKTRLDIEKGYLWNNNVIYISWV